MAKIETITQELVKKLYEYKDGFLYHKTRPSNRNKVGDLACWIITDEHKSRYLVSIKYKHYYVSRIVFLYHNGWFPDFVDHIDHDTLNNRIDNLRAATRLQNNRNMRSRKNSTSKYLGVYLVKRDNKWGAQICIDKRRTYIGAFIKEKDAALAYNEMAEKHFGEFANLNIIED